MKRTPFVIVALALVALGLFFLLGGETERARVDGTSVTEPDEGGVVDDVELVGDGDRPTRSGDGSSPARAAVDDAPAPGDLLWSDLFAPVDFASGVPVADWEVRIATREGEVLVRAADDGVRPGDLAAKRIGAIDAAGSCPRFFRTEDVAAWLDERVAATSVERAAEGGDEADGGDEAVGDDGTDELAPRRVSLFPSGTVTVRFEEGTRELEAREADAIELVLALVGDGTAGEDPRLAVEPVPDEGELRRLIDQQGTVRRILDAGMVAGAVDTDAVAHAAQLDWIVRSTEFEPVFGLDGPPFVAGLVHRRVRGLGTTPRTVDDLPIGFVAVATAYAVANDQPDVEVSTDGGQSWFDSWASSFHIDASGDALVLVRATNPARVIGALPDDASRAYYQLVAEGADPELPGARASSGGLRPGREFAIEPVHPGTYRIEVKWQERDAAAERSGGGAHVAVQRRFEVGPGEEYDLGLLVPNGARVTIVPSLEIDGVLDPTALDGALEPMQWTVGVTAVERDDPAMNGWWFGVGTSGLEPVTLLGVPTGPCELSISQDSPLIDGDSSVRFVRWRYESELDAFGDMRIDAVLEATRASPVRIDLIVPGGRLDQCVSDGAVAVRSGGDQLHVLHSGGARWDDEAGEWCWTIESALPPGVWTVSAAALTEFQGETPPTGGGVAGWVGEFELEIPAVGEVLDARFVLERGAAVTGTARAFNGEAADRVLFVALATVGARRQLRTSLARDVDAEVTFWSLVPNTTYRVEESGRTFTTGGPGSVLEFDEEDER